MRLAPRTAKAAPWGRLAGDPSRLEEITDTVTEAHGSAPRTSRHIPLRADYLRRERRSRPEGLWAPIGFAVAGHCDAGQFGGRVGVGKTAPDRATVTDR
jgi:hypothetical protein